MRSANSCSALLPLLLLVLLVFGSSAGAATFQPLDFLPDVVSGDGRVVAGAGQRWSVSQGALGGVGIDGPLVEINFDGSRIVGQAEIFTPFFPGFALEAFVWDESDGVRASNLAASGVSVYPTGMSPDGRFISGYTLESANTAPVLWDYEDIAREFLVGLPMSEGRAIANDVSNAGLVVGACCGPNESHAFSWDAIGGGVFLSEPPGPDVRSRALTISGDGQVISGWVQDAAGRRDAQWNQLGELETPMMAADSPLEILTQMLGLEVAGWTLSARDVSADGLTVVGVGIDPDGQTRGFIGVIPEPSVALLMGLGLAGLSALARRPATGG